MGIKFEKFFDLYWRTVSDNGGYVLVHSTLTNALTRDKIERIRLAAGSRSVSPSGTRGSSSSSSDARNTSDAATTLPVYEMSFHEPHKMFQNSFSVFQKREGGYAEPIHSKYP